MLVHDFARFFADKIERIRESIGNVPSEVDQQPQCETLLSHWAPTTAAEVERIIRASPSKSCPLDPIPTSLLKECLGVLLPHITCIINLSLASGVVPPNFKMARVIPTLKNTTLDANQLGSYRPVSNLPFLSKILEKVVAARLTVHLRDNNLQELHQSAYKAHHSTETALLRVQDDILNSLREHRPCLLALLDLSSAFDTVDHEILLQILEKQGISGVALGWFKSYLDSRQQCVSIGSHSSPPHPLTCGVPQGSVLGPVLFNVYTASLGALLHSHGMGYHMYADDASVYLSFELTEVDDAFTRMSRCIADVKNWMSGMRLKMNSDKTEAILLSTRHMARTIGDVPVLYVGDSNVEASHVVRSLGVLLDQCLTFEEHVNSACKTARYHLYNIQRIRHLLPTKACEQLVHAFVFAKLDYGNALLYGLPKKTLHKLQLIQNSAARVVQRVPKREHITPVLKSLHWLPIVARIDFKIALLTYKILHGAGPAYLGDLIRAHEPPRDLRTSSQLLLQHPPRNADRRSFRSAAPEVWNALPLCVREAENNVSFKRQLKTFLFNKYLNVQ